MVEASKAGLASYNGKMGSVAVISPQSFNTFGDLLRYLRERVELSQKELAGQVGYHYSYMSRIEKNQRMPDLQTLITRFIPALALDDQPQWTARLLELAGRTSEGAAAESKPASPTPITALPIFDLSASRLPIYLTPLLGRDKEVTELIHLLSRSDVRLVTLMGPPGVGKTRLAAHVAAQVAGLFAHGPLFVDMTPVTDPGEFLPTLAQAMGVVDTSDAPITRNIITSLRQRNMLLIIDNFEQIIQAASSVPNLLMGAPDIKILVTSRESLHVSSEHEFFIQPFSLSEQIGSTTFAETKLESLTHIPAVQLFLQRSQAVQPGFQIGPENISAIVEVCAKLDGLPLAIELAAARVKTLSPQAMIQQLDRRLEWLTRGSRDSARQTLRGTLEWSYSLLSEQERIVLRRLSVFVDGCTLRAAEAVCADHVNSASDAAIRSEEVLDLIVKLMDKSLVTTERSAQQVRYHMLETVSKFGREKLSQADERDEIFTRHLVHFTEYAEESESHLDGTDQAKWIRITEKEHNNFRAAIDYALTHPTVLQYGLRIGAAISLFWLECGHFQEGIQRLGKLLEQATVPEHAKERTKLLYRCGAIQVRSFNFNTAYKLFEQSIEIARTLEDKHSLASVLFYFGEICTDLKDYPKAMTLLEECISTCREIQFETQLGMALASLGKVSLEQGETRQAMKIFMDALVITERINDTWALIHALQFLGSAHRIQGELDIAIQYFERSLPYIREIGDRYAEGVALANLAILYNVKGEYVTSGRAAERSFIAFQAIGDEVQQPFPLRMMGYSSIRAGNLIRARGLIRESLKGNHEQNDQTGQLACLVALGACKLAEGNIEKAISYAALVRARLDLESKTLLEPDQLALENLINTGKNKLGTRAFKKILEQSQSLSLEDVIKSELLPADQ